MPYPVERPRLAVKMPAPKRFADTRPVGLIEAPHPRSVPHLTRALTLAVEPSVSRATAVSCLVWPGESTEKDGFTVR